MEIPGDFGSISGRLAIRKVKTVHAKAHPRGRDWGPRSARRVGKKLPAGLLDQVSAEIGVSRAEIKFRVQFADRFPDGDSLSNAVGQWPTWHQMVQEGLVQKGKRRGEIQI